MNIVATAANVPTDQPCLIAEHDRGKLKECYLVIEKQVISKICCTDAVVVLFFTFFAFKVHYPMGCTNVYTILEALLLDKSHVGRRPRVSAYLPQLSQIQ